MPRVIGVDIPAKKHVEVSLTYIYGIGPAGARRLCAETAIDPHKRADALSDDELSRITAYIERSLVVEGPLRRQVAQNISRLREIECYRGIRHRLSLPVRGQRTRTNARTRKGKRRTVAGKKGVKEMHRG
jgi:small subunit ribosomal protein S13